ncbi:hypothetical protein AB0J83_30775 [Actinoplanes sp. NPDC049596]|uniref:hypothetical protein n=1 Tax=unclassified Actinoplanes TaxID=2626549 RepID=UPI00341219F0
MNRITRMIMVSGLGIAAAATLGAGPAMAASGTSSSTASQATTNQAKHWDDDDERVVGYYRDYRRCVIAGRIGERFDRWDDFECERVGGGFHRRYVLVVEDDNDFWNDGWYNWDRDDFNDRGPSYYHRYHRYKKF